MKMVAGALLLHTEFLTAIMLFLFLLSECLTASPFGEPHCPPYLSLSAWIQRFTCVA